MSFARPGSFEANLFVLKNSCYRMKITNGVTKVKSTGNVLNRIKYVVPQVCCLGSLLFKVYLSDFED